MSKLWVVVCLRFFFFVINKFDFLLLNPTCILLIFFTSFKGNTTWKKYLKYLCAVYLKNKKKKTREEKKIGIWTTLDISIFNNKLFHIGEYISHKNIISFIFFVWQFIIKKEPCRLGKSYISRVSFIKWNCSNSKIDHLEAEFVNKCVNMFGVTLWIVSQKDIKKKRQSSWKWYQQPHQPKAEIDKEQLSMWTNDQEPKVTVLRC